MVWNRETSCGFEAQKIKYLTVPYTRGVGLDLGCGNERIWPHAIGVDRYAAEGGKGATVRGDLHRIPAFADGALDFVFSSHALEDFEAKDTRPMLREWWRVIKPGGHLILYLPHEDWYPKIGEDGCNPAHKRNFKPQDVIDEMLKIDEHGWDLVENETRSDTDEYSFFQVFRKRARADQDGDRLAPWVSREQKPVVLVIRYGGFGDMIQASSVLPGLVDQGYEVHVCTTPEGRAIVEHDPNISGWLIQDKDQVPNVELLRYWGALEQRYAKVVNLSESVENCLLPSPSEKMFHGSHEKRHFLLDRNYMEMTHAIAGVPDAEIGPRFYPSRKETERARKERDKLSHGGPVILWALAGSSVHKRYPYADNAMASILMKFPTATFVLVGDVYCKILEQGWENEKRVVCRSGEWSIRETLAFAQIVDAVVGPETGVLNAVSSNEDVAKIVFLSHSSEENLTKHWVNTKVMVPQKTACYPCHRLHYGNEFCPRDETTHASLCAEEINHVDVANAIGNVLLRPQAIKGKVAC